MDPLLLVLLVLGVGFGVAAAVSPKIRKEAFTGIAVVLGFLGLRLLDRWILKRDAADVPVPKPDKKAEEAAAEKEEAAVEAAKDAATVPKREIAPDLEKLAAKANRRRNERKP